MKRSFLPAIFLMAITSSGFAQTTYDKIYNILQNNCTSCHNANNLTGNLDLTVSSSTLYTKLKQGTPNNAAASGAGLKYIVPGDPHSSYLFKKINHGLDEDLVLDASEGVSMPKTGNPLTDKEQELIRQWILTGASSTGNEVDTTLLNTYYSGKGINSMAAVPPVANPNVKRIHLGKIFIAPDGESEFFIKNHLNLSDTIQVTELDMKMAPQAHHFIIYKFLPGMSGSFPEGLRLQNPLNGANSSNGYNTLVNAWQYSIDDQLPSGTAYIWEKTTVLDLNFHCHNSNHDSVLAADIYTDVVTQSKSTPVDIMYSELVTNTSIAIPNDATDHTFSSVWSQNSATDYYVWLLSSHTHKYGKDFDIFLRNHDGTTGQQIFEGFYNQDYTYNQGFYDWAHPPTELFSPLLAINPKDGLIQKATFNNNGSTPVSFGLTTKDEMMLYYIQYTKTKTHVNTTASVSDRNLKRNLTVYPNPSSKSIQLEFSEVSAFNSTLEIVNLFGQTEKVIEIQNGNKSITLDVLDLNNGIHFLKLYQNGTLKETQKILKN